MQIVGHRGAAGLAPENTIAALEKGIEHGADELEFDLRVTQDGLVVLHHDESITDPNGQQLLIAGHSYDLLREHKPDLTGFESALDNISHRLPLYIEVKPNEPTDPIIKIFKSRLKNGWHADEFRLASFSQQVLLELHHHLPEIDTIVLESRKSMTARRRARQLNTPFISMNQKWLWPGLISAVSKQGYKLYTYTLNDSSKANRWARHGLYGVVTDYPDQFDKL